MVERGMVLGFYQNPQIAGAVLKQIRQKGFHRSASIYLGNNDHVHIHNYRWPSLFALLIGMGGGFLLALPAANFFPSLLIALLAGALAGSLAGWLAASWIGFGIDSQTLRRYQPWLIRGESLILVSATTQDLRRALKLLRETEDREPVTFVFYSECAAFTDQEEAPHRHETLTAERLTHRARDLASASVTRRKQRGRPLLRRLLACEQELNMVRRHLTEAVRVEQSILLSAEWLLDNAYVMRGHIEEVRRNLPRRFYEQLPIMQDGPQAGLPRVYFLAGALVDASDAALNRENIHHFLQAYQSITPLTIGELWAFPLMLRLQLIEHLRHLALRVDRRQCEREQVDFWANRLLTAARRSPEQIPRFVSRLMREQPAPSAHIADQLIEHLYDAEAVLAPVSGWLESKMEIPVAEAVIQDQRAQSVQQVSLGNAISSLRLLSQLDWRELFEALCRVDAVLWTDPAGVYPRMDFATRDLYRHAVEEIARRAPVSEIEVALTALRMADDSSEPLTGHVGYFLVDDGRPLLENRVRCSPRYGQKLRRWMRSHATAVYLGSIGFLTLGMTGGVLLIAARAGNPPLLSLVLGLLTLLPASEIAVQMVNYLVTLLIPPRPLPKMSFEQSIPDSCRTLVVVPMMLLTPESIRAEVERLETRYLANPEENIRYALLSDFSDAPQQTMLEDAERLDIVVRGIEELNRRYGAGRFFLFHRERQWSETEGRWMGWERKRGKLEELNRYLVGETSEETQILVKAGDQQRLQSIQFVITLDADTQLPHDTARRMIETLAHPLNRPQMSQDRDRVERGYTIIQPRVSTSLPSATATLFSRLFTDPTGTDPYTHAVSDVYQDLMGEGSYHGKGIYDLHTFHCMLHSRFPSSHLLSHDLIEGAHVRVGLASDIELFDQFPGDYVSHSKRQHRWIRGDWQIMDWLLPRVPSGDGRRVPNPLSLLNRWKIGDNLRRSLLPVAAVALLLIGWTFSPVPSLWSWVVAVMLLFPRFLQLLNRLREWPQTNKTAWRELEFGVLRDILQAALLPHQAALALDAIGRTLYRRHVTQRLLLEWETAHQAHLRARDRLNQFVRAMLWIPASAAAAIVVFLLFSPLAARTSVPFLTLWMLSPGFVLWLSTSMRRQAALLSESDQEMLRRVARETWRFFDDFVGPHTNWLPPDNYQEQLRKEAAPRTSPTNIGLWLLSALSAQDFGFITPDDSIERIHATMQSLENLERYEGHLFNWYDIVTCETLRPRYISMVDSGNLLGALWALNQGVHGLLYEPVLGPAALNGIADTLTILRQGPLSQQSPQNLPEILLAPLESLCADPPESPGSLIRRLRSARGPAEDLAAALRERKDVSEWHLYWAGQVARQVAEWNVLLDRYLSWYELLENLPQEGLLSLGAEAHEWRRQALQINPSLQALATGQITGLTPLVAVGQGQAGTLPLTDSVRSWLNQLVESFCRAQWFAGERIAQAEEALAKSHQLADGMKFRFLYDAERHIFAIGYNVDDRRRDNFYYDMFASEARLGSFVAIARGEVPVEHWFALSRPFARAYGQRALLSWNGTMFEYLMPLLLTRSFENSLLDQACEAAVICQMAYGRQRRIPWGISEAGHSALDARQVYQYYAFGIPALGLKRGLEEGLVVAPYASALALAVAPSAAVANLRRLAHLSPQSMYGDYGFYEAIDYTRQRDPQGAPGVIVYSYMAHHQGMTLLAIDNVLHNNIMQQRFHADPRVIATEALLYERIPTGPVKEKEPESASPLPRLAASISPFTGGRADTPHTSRPRTHLLSNTEYSVLITNAGGGCSRWRDLEITRWRADTTRDAWGNFCYIRDLDTRQFWSAAYHPVGVMPRLYTSTFTLEKAEFRRRDFDIETLTEIVVSPEDDAEIRRMTLINHSQQIRRIELTSYAEIALAPHNADRAHPAFSKLFVQTEALPDYDALLAWRRPRSAHDPTPWAVHIVAASFAKIMPVQFETDRARFLGRGRTAASPVALERNLTNTAGAVLDPVFSLRRQVILRPGERLQVAFITGAGSSREEVVALAEKYADFRAVNRAMELAWTHAQLDLRHLRIQQEEAMRFQQLAGYILYPGAAMRATEVRLRRNTLSQSRLWAHGISGDLPIVVATIGDTADMDVIRQLLMAHTYWRLRGLKCDLVILNEEASSYEQPLHNQLRRLIQAHSQITGMDQPGGVFLRPAAQIPPEDLNLLFTVARAVLVAARGSLAQQIGGAGETRAYPPPLQTGAPPWAEEPSAPLPYMELPYFNGLGGFTPDGKEYAIYLGPEAETPAPWINVMANPYFGTLVSESGSGFSWYGNSQSNRLTPWSNDPVSDPSGEYLYIRDDDLNVVWTPTAGPIREKDAYRARHGQGYTVFEHNSHAIEQELTTFVPVDDSGGAPVRIQKLRLRNASSRRRRLTITSFAEWTLGTEREETQMHVVTRWDSESHALLAQNAFHPDFGDRIAFASSSPPFSTFTGDRTEFLGRNGSPASPEALKRIRLSDRAGAGMDPCAALQLTLEIEPGQEKEVIFLLGQAASVEEARALVMQYRSGSEVARALQETKDWWDRLLGTIQVETPDKAVNFLLNRWLLYQDLSCRIWARSAFYQSGGAYGFRDQLQDAMAMVYAAPALAREQILRTAARQFLEGDVQHWWHPPSGAGVRTRISDDLLWLPFVTAHYVRVTGDDSILDAAAPFLEGKVLDENEHEAFFVPTVSEQEASLLEHCRRAIQKGLTSGPHGLPLIGGGDWNDGMNRVGVEGKGESVWLAWFLAHILHDFAELLRLRGKETEAKEWEEKAANLAQTIEREAWDGEWYLRAYFDDGTPLGSHESEEAKIDSLAQSWAVISGKGDPERAATALQSVARHLVREEEKMALLFTPPFDKTEHDPGYIKGYLPGVRENGGQYTHGSLWVPIAFARRGDGDTAVKLLQMMNPVEHSREADWTELYKVEPYVVAADIYALEGQTGRGGWTWYTGSAGWMYRAWLEEVLGFHLRGDTLSINPVIASKWDGFTLKYRYGSALYEIIVENPQRVSRGVASMKLDGDPVTENKIRLQDDGKEHILRIRLGAPKTSPVV